jgi:hypothetical protein
MTLLAGEIGLLIVAVGGIGYATRRAAGRR